MGHRNVEIRVGTVCPIFEKLARTTTGLGLNVLPTTRIITMDSHANAATPSKAGREGMTGAADLSTPGPAFGTPAMMDISSPDPAAFSFARQKHPPAISSKPRSSRKVSSLFSGESGETAGPSDAAAAAATADAAAKKWVSDNNGIVPAGGSLCSEGDQAASPQSSSGGGGGGGAGFTSPVRASQESGATSSRFTPQRNLGGLFASPLAPPPPLATHEDGGAHHSLTAAVPLLLQSPKRKEAPAPAPAGKREGETDVCVCVFVRVCLCLCVCTSMCLSFFCLCVVFHTCVGFASIAPRLD